MSSNHGPFSRWGAGQPAAASRPYLGLGLGILAVSSASLLIRFAQSAGAPSLVIAAYRLGLASLVLAPFALWRQANELRAFTPRHWLLVLTSGIFLGTHFAAWISSLAYTSVASSVVLVSASPLFVALLAATALRERPSRAVVVGLILAFAGAVVVGLSDACVASGCPSWQTFWQGRVLWLVRLPITGYSGPAYLWLTLLAMVPQLVGHSSFNWALKYLPATLVAVALLGEPAGSIVLAAVLLNEVPGLIELAGCLLILAGIVLAARQPQRGNP